MKEFKKWFEKVYCSNCGWTYKGRRNEIMCNSCERNKQFTDGEIWKAALEMVLQKDNDNCDKTCRDIIEEELNEN